MLQTNLLAESAIGGSNATLTSLWASSISNSHILTGQPFRVRVTPARQNAVSSISRVPSWEKIPTFAMWRSRLSDDDFSRVAEDTELPGLLREIYHLALTCEEPSVDELSKLAREIAAILIEREQWGNAFGSSLKQLLSDERDEPNSATEKIDDLIVGRISPYLVIVGVGGTRSIEGISSFTGGRIRVIRDEDTDPVFPDWGPSGTRAKEFVTFLCQQRPAYMNYETHPPIAICLEVRVDSVGVEAAAEEARRVVLRLIDSISAAHPTTRVQLSDVAAVGRMDSISFNVHSYSPSISRSVRVPTSAPPSPLKESMRAASLIRRLDDPLTRAAFSWISLETAGLKPSDFQSCGKALALYSIRQQAIVAYRQLVRGVGNYSSMANHYRARSETLLRRSRRLEKFSPSKSSDQIHVHNLKLKYSAGAKKAKLEAQKSEARLQSATEAIDKIEVCEPGLAFGDKRFGAIVDMPRWQHQLSIADGPSLLSDLFELLPAWASESARRIGELLGSEVARQEWLESTYDYYSRLLDGVYSARNVHLHNGLSDVPGSVLLGVASELVSDAILEVCLYWHSQGGEDTPRDIILQLAERFDSIMQGQQQHRFDISTVLTPAG